MMVSHLITGRIMRLTVGTGQNPWPQRTGGVDRVPKPHEVDRNLLAKCTQELAAALRAATFGVRAGDRENKRAVLSDDESGDDTPVLVACERERNVFRVVRR
jgi:hypothetical protein